MYNTANKIDECKLASENRSSHVRNMNEAPDSDHDVPPNSPSNSPQPATPTLPASSLKRTHSHSSNHSQSQLMPSNTTDGDETMAGGNPGEVQTPQDDGHAQYNVIPHDASMPIFQREHGVRNLHLRAGTSDATLKVWDTKTLAVRMVPLSAGFSVENMTSYRSHAKIFTKRAFPHSNSVIRLPAPSGTPPEDVNFLAPWGIVVDGLHPSDKECLLARHFWHTASFSFLTFPLGPFESRFVGNYRGFFSEPEDVEDVIRAVELSLLNPTSPLAAELLGATKNISHFVTGIRATHFRFVENKVLKASFSVWAIHIPSPAPLNEEKHTQWLEACKRTVFENAKVGVGAGRYWEYPSGDCTTCKGRTHPTGGCPLKPFVATPSTTLSTPNHPSSDTLTATTAGEIEKEEALKKAHEDRRLAQTSGSGSAPARGRGRGRGRVTSDQSNKMRKVGY